MKSSLKLLKKNTVFETINIINYLLYGERNLLDDLPKDLAVNDLVYFKYARLTSTDVERCFSKYKNLLFPNQRTLDFENLKKVQINTKTFLSIYFFILHLYMLINCN
jgi:hypothetical protein